jgi:aconitase A
MNVAQKLISSHLVSGEMNPGSEIGLRIDQTLTQDATGTVVMLELEAMTLDRVRTEVSVQYVDHNLLQADERNAEDHLFLRSACRRFGLWFSKPGNGVSHPTHMQRFGRPGASLVGSDSHTCAAGSLGMLAIGVGGVEVALAMAGRPLYLTMPEAWGVELTGRLPPWVSAKDVILEMLRRHDVKGAVNRILEYHGPGVAGRSAMDRHVIANMGAELGATTTVFPADEAVREFWAPRTARPTSPSWSPTPMPATTSPTPSSCPACRRWWPRRAPRATWCRSAPSRAPPSTRWSSGPAPIRGCATSRSWPPWCAAGKPARRSVWTSTRRPGRFSRI